jgi:transcriptional regulator with XRE-family HTH domain
VPGSIIKKNREAKNFTQDYVARQMNMSQNAYSKIENGNTQLTVHHLKELSRVLEVSILDLLRDDFEIHKPNYIQTESVSKEHLLLMLDNLKNKLAAKYPQKHEFYPILMSLCQTLDNTIEQVH